jgi:hypothetical protein
MLQEAIITDVVSIRDENGYRKLEYMRDDTFVIANMLSKIIYIMKVALLSTLVVADMNLKISVNMICISATKQISLLIGYSE